MEDRFLVWFNYKDFVCCGIWMSLCLVVEIIQRKLAKLSKCKNCDKILAQISKAQKRFPHIICLIGGKSRSVSNRFKAKSFNKLSRKSMQVDLTSQHTIGRR